MNRNADKCTVESTTTLANLGEIGAMTIELLVGENVLPGTMDNKEFNRGVIASMMLTGIKTKLEEAGNAK